MRFRVSACVWATCVFVLAAASAHAQSPTSFKLAFWNIKSGKGQVALPAHPATFIDTANCTDPSKPLNAWGLGLVQKELVAKIKNDPQIVALGLAEAWTTVCGSPENVRAALGWKSRTSEQNGLAVVARYGFAGPAQWQQLDTSLAPTPSDLKWIVRVPVCLDAQCSASMTMFATHWTASNATAEAQAQGVVAFMSTLPETQPRVLLGDFNVWEGTAPVCNQSPKNTALGYLRSAGYTDAWPKVNGTAEGYTGMTNRAGCGVPEGYTWKRIDYAWSKNIQPVSTTRFGIVTPGDAAPSDHYGIIVEYSQTGMPADVTPPTVSITSPAPSATVAGPVTVVTPASDDRAVARVDLLLDGTVIGSVNAAPYQFVWDTTTVVNGVHVLQARAFDTANHNTDSATVGVSVNNDSGTQGPKDGGSAGAGEVVIYAMHATAVAGNWQTVADATAAGGARMSNPNAGAAKLTTAAAAPASYFEASFWAQAGTPYRLWLRGKAESNAWANDSVFVQFDGSVTSAGAATSRIGTTSAFEVNLEDCSGCGLSGWGWQDNGWGVGVLGPVVYFAQSGKQTLRIHPREDGLSIDQIVLSPSAYLNAAPGALKNDAIILAEATGLGAQPMVWTNNVNTAASADGSLKKTSGCDGCGDAGATSVQQLTSGDGYVSFVPSVGYRFFAGLSNNTTTSTAPSDVKFGFSFWPSGTWDIRESGVYRAEGTYVAGDTFRIALSGSSVIYYRNDTVVYTSTVTPTFPLVMDASLLNVGSTVGNAIIAPNGSGAAPAPAPEPAPAPTPAPTPPPPTSSSCSASSTVPTCYDAATDRVARSKPNTPAPTAAGSTINDATFGSRILRVTDGSTRPGAPGRSYRTPSGSHQNAWSVSGRYFYVVSTDGTVIPFTFDAQTMSAARVAPSATGEGGLTLKLWGEPQFSFVNDAIIYGIYNGSGANLRTVSAFDFTSGSYTSILDLDTVVSGLAGTYVGQLASSAGPVEKLSVFFGGATQDQHRYELVFDRANPASRKLVDTVGSTVDGVATNIPLNFHLHHAFMDKSGRYVMLYPTAVDRQAPRSAAAAYVWDTATNQFTPMSKLPEGHDTLGYGYYVNQDCCSTTTWDAAQWQLRSYADVQSTRDLITPVLTPKEVYLADHQSWTNAQQSVLVPIVSGSYRYGTNATEWRAWDEEIVAIQTDLAAGTTVWRFAHHRSNVRNDNDPNRTYFWYTPRPIVSQNGRWALFTSNWDKTLGTDPAGEAGGLFRQDAFIVELKAQSSLAPIEIAPVSPPSGVVGAPYSLTLHIDGGATALTWNVAGGALPAGLALDAAGGTISGTPIEAGTFSFVVGVSDGSTPPRTDTETVTISIQPAFTVSIAPAATGQVGVAFGLSAKASGAVGAVTWETTAGNLPPGLTLNAATGTIAGIPTASGGYTVTVQGKDSANRVSAVTTTITVASSPVAIVTTSLPNGAMEQLYQTALLATGGSGVVNWRVSAGALPDGLTLSTDGVISGSPAKVGVFAFTVEASDARCAETASRSFSVTVGAREIVRYASEATAIAGTWSLVADSSAAGGKRIASANLGAAKVTTALANPANYFEMTFQAEAGVPYHLWVRGKADANSWANDSVMVQFSGSVDASGTPKYRIGTTSANEVNLEDCSGCGLSGWGWQDNGWGVNVMGPAIYFEQSGTQTLRAQVREDGFSVDQIVLSADKYISVAPGTLKDDTTIIAR